MSTMKPISSIAASLGLSDHEYEPRSRHTAKVELAALDARQHVPDGKLVLVTGITPTSAGEGKTVTSIGLGQGFARIGRKAVVALRQPSLGPVFGVKGGATGGGKSQVLPSEGINLHFTGDIHAVVSAHNLLSALADNALEQGNRLNIDPDQIIFPRTLDMNDRALRNILLSQGKSGVPHAGGFVITAASEVMAILALAESLEDLKRRCGEIVVAFTRDGLPVRARDLKAQGAMTAILRDALKPNLVQTTEGTPAFVHAGPFGNIAHGTNSILATRLARKLGEFTVFECGFGADLGAEKFLDIVAPQFDLVPNVIVIVASVRAFKRHGGVKTENLGVEDVERTVAGLPNLKKHVENMQGYGIPTVVALNRFASDTEAELRAVEDACHEWSVPVALNEAYLRGGEGTVELARLVEKVAEEEREQASGGAYRPLYAPTLDPRGKIERIAKEIYGADGVDFTETALAQMARWIELGYGHLTICMAKTQNSLTDDAKKLGAPKGWRLKVREVVLRAGAGYLVPICGSILLMPGLPEEPAAWSVDVDADGEIVGLR